MKKIFLLFVILSLAISLTNISENPKGHIYEKSIEEKTVLDSDLLWITPLEIDGNQITTRHVFYHNDCIIISGYENLAGFIHGGSRTILDDEGTILDHYRYYTNNSILINSNLASEDTILSVGSQFVGEHNSDLWMIKTDSNHNVEWQHTYGGYETEYGSKTTTLEDGSYLILGLTGSYGAGWYDIWLMKTDSQGNELWNKTYGGIGEDYGTSIIPLNDSYLIFGRVMTSTDYDLLLININETGEIQWQKTYDCGNNTMDYCRDADLLSNGHILITLKTKDSNTQEEYFRLLTINQTGDIIDSHIYGQGKETINTLIPTQDGGFLAVGGTETYGTYDQSTQQRKDDMWVVKLDQNVDIEWMKSYGGLEEDGIIDFCLDKDENLLAIAMSYSFEETISQYALKIKSEPTIQQGYFIGFLKENVQQGHVNIWTPAFLLEKNVQGITFHTSTDQLIIQSSSSSGKQYTHFAIGTYNILDRN